jgi:hypothetical protein
MFVDDEVVKGSLAGYTFEHMEIASYKILIAAAEAAGETEVVAVCQANLAEEVAMAECWMSTPRGSPEVSQPRPNRPNRKALAWRPRTGGSGPLGTVGHRRRQWAVAQPFKRLLHGRFGEQPPRCVVLVREPTNALLPGLGAVNCLDRFIALYNCGNANHRLVCLRA